VYESGVARLWEVARFNLVARCGVILPRNLIKTSMCVCFVAKNRPTLFHGWMS